MDDNTHFETLALHAGYVPGKEDPSRAIPISRSAAYLFNNAEHAANLFALKEPGYIYGRLQNPTQDALERRMAALEGGKAALALSSGTSAIHYAVINLAKAGDELIASKNLYGGTYTMFNDILPDYGIHTHFVDPWDLKAIKAAINGKTKLIFLESIDNPTLKVPDIKAIADLAHEAGLPLMIDSTFATPYLLRPIEFGADIVIHSLTKWIGGHGTGLGGIVVDAGNFDWTQERFKSMNEPDPSYHGLRYARDFGDANNLAFINRLRLVPLRNLGAVIAPDTAWLFLQGLETLALRMERHCENALRLARYLEKHPRVEWVSYPGLEKDPSHELAKKYFKKGFGGMVVFGIKGGRKAGESFINSLKIFSLLANVGDAKSLAIHPASTTHSQMSEEQQLESGIGPELVRLSVGIEYIDDLIADVEQALASV